MLFKETGAVCSENHKSTKSINKLCGQNAELLTVKTDGTYSYHGVIKCLLNYLQKINTATDCNTPNIANSN
jgi:hypothetical protein